jgi:hypothetical protein
VLRCRQGSSASAALALGTRLAASVTQGCTGRCTQATQPTQPTQATHATLRYMWNRISLAPPCRV